MLHLYMLGSIKMIMQLLPPPVLAPKDGNRLAVPHVAAPPRSPAFARAAPAVSAPAPRITLAWCNGTVFTARKINRIQLQTKKPRPTGRCSRPSLLFLPLCTGSGGLKASWAALTGRRHLRRREAAAGQTTQ